MKVTGRGEVSVLNESFINSTLEDEPFPGDVSAPCGSHGRAGSPSRIVATIAVMRARAFSAAAAAVLVAAFLAAPGCGSDDPPAEAKQSGETVECGPLRCNPVILPGDQYPDIPACCVSDGVCGLNGEQFEQYGANFEDPCQPRDQPGDLDSECADSEPIATDFGPLIFKGCCTAPGACGYMVDEVLNGIVTLGLGCVNAQPFLDSGVPAPCTPGGGAGGAGGGGSQ